MINARLGKHYSTVSQLLEECINRSWTSGFTEDERAQTFWGKRYIDDAVGRRRDRNVDSTYDDKFFFVTDAQFSTVAMVDASTSRIVERTTYDAYGKARHHFGGDVTGEGAATSAGDQAAITASKNAGSNSIGEANYKVEEDLNRDGDITNGDLTTLAALTGGADQAALVSGQISFTTTGTGGTTVHGPDNAIGYDGYVFNFENSQYTVRFRWYDPTLGRWLERDSLGAVDGVSMYLYVRSRPSNRRDAVGTCSFDDPEMRPYRKPSGELRYGHIYDMNGCVIDYVPDPNAKPEEHNPFFRLHSTFDFVYWYYCGSGQRVRVSDELLEKFRNLDNTKSAMEQIRQKVLEQAKGSVPNGFECEPGASYQVTIPTIQQPRNTVGKYYKGKSCYGNPLRATYCYGKGFIKADVRCTVTIVECEGKRAGCRPTKVRVSCSGPFNSNDRFEDPLSNGKECGGIPYDFDTEWNEEWEDSDPRE